MPSECSAVAKLANAQIGALSCLNPYATVCSNLDEEAAQPWICTGLLTQARADCRILAEAVSRSCSLRHRLTRRRDEFRSRGAIWAIPGWAS